MLKYKISYLKKLVLGFVAIISFVSISACSDQVERAKFEALHRSLHTISASTNHGVSYNDFSKLVTNYSAEIAILKGTKLNTIEKELYENYLKTNDIYKHSLFLWTLKMDSKAPTWAPYGSFAPNFFQLGISNYTDLIANTRHLTEIYNIRTFDNPDNETFALDRNSVEYIWKHAEELLEVINNIYINS